MTFLQRSRWLLAAFAIVTVALLLKLLADPLLEDQKPFLLFFSAIAISAWLGGFSAGIIATVVAVLYTEFFFISPRREFGIDLPGDLVQIVLFFGEGVFITYITSTLRDTRQQFTKTQRNKEEITAMLDAIQVHAPFGLAFLDKDLRYLRINSAMAELNGISPAAHIGRTLKQVQPQLDDATLQKVRRVFHTGTPLLDQEVTITKSTMLGIKRQHLLTNYYRIRGQDGEPLGVGALMVDVTDRKRAEEALRENERRFRSMIDTAPVLIWISDVTKACIHFNKVWLEFTGRTMEQELGSGWAEGVHPDDYARCLDTYTSAFEARKPFTMEYRLRRHDGEYRWMLDNGIPRYSHEGRFEGFIGSCIDITERKQYEMNQRFLLEADETLASSLDYESTLSTVARLAVPDFADWCAVDIVDDTGKVERLAVVHIEADKARLVHEIQRRYPINLESRYGLANVLRTGKPEFLPDVSEERIQASARNPEDYEMMRSVGFSSVMIVPLVARGRTLGAITFVSGASGRRYTPSDLQLAESLAARAALAVDNARLYAQARGEREHLRVMLASIGDAVIATDKHGNITYISSAAENLTGWKEDEARGKRLDEIFRIIDETSHDPIDNPVTKVLRHGGKVAMANHTLLITRDGREIPIDNSGSPIRADNGSLEGVVLVFRSLKRDE